MIEARTITWNPEENAYQKDGSYVHNMYGGIPIHVPATINVDDIASRVTKYTNDNGRLMAIVRFTVYEEDKRETLHAVYDYTYGSGKEYYTKKWRYTRDRSTEFEAMHNYLIKTLDMRRGVNPPKTLTDDEVLHNATARYSGEKCMAILKFVDGEKTNYVAYDFTGSWDVTNKVSDDFDALDSKLRAKYDLRCTLILNINNRKSYIENYTFDEWMRHAQPKRDTCDPSGIVGCVDNLTEIYATLLDFIEYKYAEYPDMLDGNVELRFGVDAIDPYLYAVFATHPEIEYCGQKYILVRMDTESGLFRYGYVRRDKAYNAEVGNRYITSVRGFVGA